MTDIPSLVQLLRQAVENRLLDVHTAIIGRIENYDSVSQMADIQPMLKRTLSNTNGQIKQEDLPLLIDVPVIFPRAGGFFLSLPIQKGDFVQVIFNEANIDNFLTASAYSIDSVSRFTLQGAVAIPGIFQQSGSLNDAHHENLVIGRDKGVQIHIDGNKIRLGSADANEALAMASKVKDELEKFRAAYNNHVHPAPHGSPTASLILSVGEIATTKVVAS